MKATHLLSLACLALGAMAFTACSDDNDLPDVKVSVNFENAVVKDGSIYVTPGTDLKITSIDVTNNEQGKKAIITGAYFYWDYVFIGGTVMPPYSYNIAIPEDAEIGSDDLLEITFPVYAEGKSPANGLVDYKVYVVAPEDMPADGVAAYQKTPVFREMDK